jgi:hypothetical protein
MKFSSFVKIFATSSILIDLTLKLLYALFVADFIHGNSNGVCSYKFEKGHLETHFIKPDSNNNLLLYITNLPHKGPASCLNVSIKEGGEFNLLNYSIKCLKEEVFVNNTRLDLSDSIEFHKQIIDYSNLWFVYNKRTKLTNKGLIRSYRGRYSKLYEEINHKVQFVTGVSRFEKRLNPWIFALYIGILAYVVMLIFHRKIKKS